ncbi:MAG: HEPN domain-containing protein [Deltaproteobacteria bacterium]|nr:HEPN domain-containing protein [Deltaproteobacteria bacterium]
MSPKSIEALAMLPNEVQMQLTDIAEVFAAVPAVELFLLFGSYARGDYVIDHNTGYRSDFDLLAVTKTAKDAADYNIFMGLEERTRQIAGKTPVSLIRHDIAELNREIRMGQFFFADIIREGIVLYDSHHVQLAKPKAVTLQERFELTRGYFNTWFASASSLWTVAHHIPFIERRMAAFLLHQAAERFYHAVTLVYDGYKHRTHNLELLASYAEPHHQLLQPSLARTSADDEHYFSLLKRAYIEARYSLKYDVTKPELTEMYLRVFDFAKRVRSVCLEKLASYFGAEALGELPDIEENVDLNELPPPPDNLNDQEALDLWQMVVKRFVQKRGDERYEEGHEAGKQEGEFIGELRGKVQERAQAIIDVLAQRNIAISDTEREQILNTRDEEMLKLYWQRVFEVQSVTQMFVINGKI